MKKWIKLGVKWGVWFALAFIIILTGYGVNQAISKGIGGLIMLLGTLFLGFLFAYGAYKNLKQ